MQETKEIAARAVGANQIRVRPMDQVGTISPNSAIPNKGKRERGKE